MPEENAALLPCPAGTELDEFGRGRHTPAVLALDFSMIGDGRFVGVSPASNSIVWTVNITGLQDCGRVYVSPSGKVGAIACFRPGRLQRQLSIPPR